MNEIEATTRDIENLELRIDAMEHNLTPKQQEDSDEYYQACYMLTAMEEYRSTLIYGY